MKNLRLAALLVVVLAAGCKKEPTIIRDVPAPALNVVGSLLSDAWHLELGKESLDRAKVQSLWCGETLKVSRAVGNGGGTITSVTFIDGKVLPLFGDLRFPTRQHVSFRVEKIPDPGGSRYLYEATEVDSCAVAEAKKK